MINRLFVEKKSGYDTVRRQKQAEIENALGVKFDSMRMLLRYDVEGMEGADYEQAKATIFSEPPVDNLYEESVDLSGVIIGTELLPGQYDQRADSASQCVQLLTRKARPLIRTATIYAFSPCDETLAERLKKYLVNPVESRLCALEKPTTLTAVYDEPAPVPEVSGFIDMTDEQIEAYHKSMGFAMSIADIKFVREYFRSEQRNPIETELKVIDTYWSDHCRHTTFSTHLTDIAIESDVKELFEAKAEYDVLHSKRAKGREDKKYPTLMDMATIGAWSLKKENRIPNLDESEEINACSIKVKADVDGKDEDWLVMFKNETHNHPTEIEPFGGAATCLGGAIRDPLSGRVYVYQSMRVTGAGDITEPMSKTMKGKLPQRTISSTAAAGFSSYGNQIGLATGQVHELYHKGYVAKRLETGFVVGAAPAENVVRERPSAGDVILLIGGETGRDGCGGATGSSKAHTVESLDTCGAEVQKGNPLTERKIQRLFRNKAVTTLIKRCNDFGAGGVSVAVGELADGLDIDLDAVPKKYQGLTSTELAISESQERMAVVVDYKDVEKMQALCVEENLLATPLAKVTDLGRMRMFHGGRKVVDLSREFLNTNGASQSHKVVIRDNAPSYFAQTRADEELNREDYAGALKKTLASFSSCSRKGLTEMFDSTIGASTVYMPFGGKNQLTPSVAMSALLPVPTVTNTATVSAYACYPDLLSDSRFVGATYSVFMSALKVAATGASFRDARLTLQEFFEKLGDDNVRWGRPTSALLGALYAQRRLGLGAIGGKDSMSGSFEDLDVPPTLISFALSVADARSLVTNVLKADQKVYRICMRRTESGMPDFDYACALMDTLHAQIQKGNVNYCQVVEEGGSAVAVMQSCFGEGVGFDFASIGADSFTPNLGDLLVSATDITAFDEYDTSYYGITTADGKVSLGGDISDYITAFTGTLEKNFRTTAPASGEAPVLAYADRVKATVKTKVAKPKVFIPVFPGTNCEYDTARAFEKAGGEADIFVIRNRTASEIDESVEEIVKRINSAQILMFPGGFSGGDEPDGSGKFIATTFRNGKIADAVHNLLDNRDGLILGICNGFQALVKTGLLPGGKISVQGATSPTLTFNNIARHVSQIVTTKVASVKSPWLAGVNVGDVYGVAVSHGEGRFVATEEDLKLLASNGQIATQYCDLSGNATMQSPFNPNGSMYAIEGITSLDGRIFGKMGHTERAGANLYKNVEFDYDMKLFESGVKYFK
ncbi:MAG: phosphoribosylformylglycinamidine synthase [Clostridia bacterium]|nr:phosphoribosylformylglycinamidine synthase [Clostridia bacterium]